MSKLRRKGATGWTRIHSTRVQLVMYSFLLVVTPFILLRNFLVDLISVASGAKLPIDGFGVPLVPTIAAIILVAALAYFRRFLTRRMAVAAGIVVLMDASAQRITDIYFGHNFYDLQQNWHYIAYGLFSLMVYRDLAPRGLPLSKILWITFMAALTFSSFDESFQMRMSSRVFDLSDIAKDVWGCLMGLVLIVLSGGRVEELLAARRAVGKGGIHGHVRNPFFVLIVLIVFDLILLGCASLLSEFTNLLPAVAATILIFIVLAGAYALCLRRVGRIVVIVLLLGSIALLGRGLLSERGDPIGRNMYGLTVYRGVPLPFFDVMIYPNGRYRLVDKKHYFNQRDQKFLLRQRSDIILIGAGDRGLGGKGFPELSMVQFLYNRNLNRATQVIIMNTPDACRAFNRLKREGRNVLFVIHNTC